MMSALTAYLPYITFFVSVFLCFSVKHKNALYFAFFIIVIFSGLRFHVGQDFDSYYNAIVYNEAIGRFELIPRILIYISRWLELPVFFFFITSLLTNLLIAKSIDLLSKDKFVSVICYICLPFLFFEYMCIVRQALAVAIVLYAYSTFLMERKYSRFISLIILASFCHITAFIALVFIIPFDRMSFKKHLILFIICFIFGNSFNIFISSFGIENYISTYYSRYLLEENQSFGNSMKVLYFMIAMLNLYMIRDKYLKDNIIINSVLSFINIGASIYFLFSFNNLFASRITSYFFILLVLSFSYYRFSFINQKICKMFIVLLMLILFYIELNICYNEYVRTGDGNYIPYNSFIINY